MLLNAEKYQGYIFYHFWVIKGKPTGEGGNKITPLLRLGLIKCSLKQKLLQLPSWTKYFEQNGEIR